MTTPAEHGIVTKTSPYDSSETLARLLRLLDEKGLTVFATVDHSAAARAVGLELRETTVVIFGNPRGGTPAMAASPTLALDLPLKVLIWDDEGTTRVTYTSPAELAARHAVAAELAAPLAGIDGLTDALVAR